MRITIDIDEKQPAAVVKTTAEQAITTAPRGEPETAAISAGPPPADLLQALGETPLEGKTRMLSFPGTPEEHADAMLAGPPPEWLVQAIESAKPSRFGRF